MKKSSIFLILVFAALTVLSTFFIAPDFWGNKWRPWRLGLDLVGGSHLVYEVDLSAVPDFDQSGVMSGLKDVIERRVNLFGVAEPQVLTAQSGDSHRLIVELAGISDISAAINQIGETPVLEFYEQVPPGEEAPQTPSFVEITGEDGTVQQVPVEVEDLTGEPQIRRTELTGRYVRSASLAFNPVTGAPEVVLNFDEEGAKIFEDVTERNVGLPVAVLLDGAIITNPTVQQKIVGGTAQITGDFTLEEAKTLVERFNAGALPAPITLISQQTVGATLGKGSLTKTLWAGLIGTLLVILFMLLYYRKLGVFASIALVMYIILLLGLFKLFGITMTLAGIAGIILSIGMAVDANILIFERTKEERERGVNETTAITEGFSRAWPSIRDSNITSMITAVILYSFTSSFVKGFALALLLGVIMSMITAITITRVFLLTFIKSKKKLA